LVENGFAAAPDDLEVLEFALQWRVNPQEIRESWSLRDLHWLQLLEHAKELAAPAIDRKARERAAKAAKKKKK